LAPSLILLRQQDPRHIAHYVRLDKTEQKFGWKVLQIHNARTDTKLRRVVVGADGTRADGLVRHTTMHYTIKVRFIRPKSIIILMSQTVEAAPAKSDN